MRIFKTCGIPSPVGATKPAETNGETNLTVNLSAERVAIDDLHDYAEGELEMMDWARVERFRRAMQRGAYVPPAFIVRQGDKLSLHYGDEQIIAARELGLAEVDAIVFPAANGGEADAIGEAAFNILTLADEIGEDSDRSGRKPSKAGAVSLLPMHPADRARVAARVRKAGMESD